MTPLLSTGHPSGPAPSAPHTSGHTSAVIQPGHASGPALAATHPGHASGSALAATHPGHAIGPDCDLRPLGGAPSWFGQGLRPVSQHCVAGQGPAIPAHNQQRRLRLPAARSAATLLLLLVALLLPLAASAAKPQPRAAVQVAEKAYDFGTIRQTDPSVVHVFKIRNTGDAPLVIISATASCGCTRPTFTDHPVAPGQEAEIKVTFVPRGQLGDINKEVKVRTNAPDAKRFSLRITGKVTP